MQKLRAKPAGACTCSADVQSLQHEVSDLREQVADLVDRFPTALPASSPRAQRVRAEERKELARQSELRRSRDREEASRAARESAEARTAADLAYREGPYDARTLGGVVASRDTDPAFITGMRAT